MFCFCFIYIDLYFLFIFQTPANIKMKRLLLLVNLLILTGLVESISIPGPSHPPFQFEVPEDPDDPPPHDAPLADAPHESPADNSPLELTPGEMTPTVTLTLECDCLEVEVCLFVMKGQRNINKNKNRMTSALTRASDLLRHCCISFKLSGGKVHTLDYDKIEIGSNGKTIKDLLGPRGQLRLKNVGESTHIVDKDGNQIEDFDLDTVLRAIRGAGQALCGDDMKEGKTTCKRLRSFGFDRFVGTNTVGYGSRPGETTYLDLSSDAMGSTMAHEFCHNFGLKHTEDDPTSDENGDPNNLMHGSHTGEAPGRGALESKSSLSGEQCKAARKVIEDAKPPYCHTRRKNEQCPSTIWDEIRDEFSDKDLDHKNRLKDIDDKNAKKIADKREKIKALKARIKKIEEFLKTKGILTRKEEQDLRDEITKLRDAFNKLRDKASVDLEAYKQALPNPTRDQRQLKTLGSCVTSKQRRQKVPKNMRFPFKSAPKDLVDKCFESLVKSSPRNYYKPAKELRKKIKKAENTIARNDKLKKKHKKYVDSIDEALKKIKDFVKDIRDLERERLKQISDENKRHKQLIKKCEKKRTKDTHGIYNRNREVL